MFTEIQPKSKDFALNRNCWFLMILAKFYQKFLPNAKFDPVCLFFLCVSPSSSATVFFFFFFYSSPDLNFGLYSPYILQDFRFKIQNFQLLIGQSPSDTPYAMCASVQLTLTLHQIPPPPHHHRHKLTWTHQISTDKSK